MRAKAFLSFFLCIFLLFITADFAQAEKAAAEQLYSLASELIEWKKEQTGVDESGGPLSPEFISLAGSTAGDWYPIALSALGFQADYAGYLTLLRENVESRYRQPGQLSSSKASEWHRIILAVLACGGNPESFGTDENGESINLTADGVLYRENLGRQGINGYIWGLIALDAAGTEPAADALNDRESIKSEILSAQLADGGWALYGDTADADLTAMAIQALSAYYDSRGEVKEAVDRALSCLSRLQLPDGDFNSWGTENSESTAQVIIALCCLNIDFQTDVRFIKEGNTLLDGLLKYKNGDGGFAHSFDFDADNPEAAPGVSDSMAGEQALCALAAALRFYEGKPALYDFSDRLLAEEPSFTQEDIDAVNALPAKSSTQYYAEVLKYLDKAYYSENAQYIEKLERMKLDIQAVQAEIDALNAEIERELYPFDSITLSDKKTVDGITERYERLSAYDREKINCYDDVLKAAAATDTLFRSVIIFVFLSFLTAVLLPLSVKRIKKRLHAKQAGLEQLRKACSYVEEGDDE